MSKCSSNSFSHVNDAVYMSLELQRNIVVADPTPITDLSLFTTVYIDETNFPINGTILAVNNGAETNTFSNGTVVIMVNNNVNTQFFIPPNESMSKTFGTIDSIQVAVTSSPLSQTGNYEAILELSFSLNYKF
ncbi:S-Ena type endospore appendage [Halalkalibacter sp. AB-rgal2]|uniref:S-Ena type endospore appendage n=1 Tax=Halalkalibacter sp. AB-rgal2 TaxID=3242695 RepID=UPI00359CBB86